MTSKSGTIIIGYGAPGCGKTLAGAAFCAEVYARTGKKVEVADYEASTVAYPLVDDEPWDIVEPAFEETAIQEAFDIQNRRLERLRKGEIVAAVDDTLSSLSAYMMEEILTKKYGGDRVSIKSGNVSIVNPSQQDYGMAVRAVTKWVRNNATFVREGGTLLWLTHEKELEMEIDGGIQKPAQVGPLFIGKQLTREIARFPHVTLRFFAKKKTGQPTPEYMVQTSHDGAYYAKDRLRVLPAAPFPWTGKDDESILAAGRKIWAPIFDRRGPYKKEN